MNSKLCPAEANIRKDIKSDRDREEKVRHDLRGWIQKTYSEMDTKLDDAHTNIELLKQWHKTMDNKIDRIEVNQEKGFQKIENLINGLEDKFATKAEHQENKTRLDSISKILWSIWGMIWVAIVGALLNLIIR